MKNKIGYSKKYRFFDKNDFLIFPYWRLIDYSYNLRYIENPKNYK